MGDSAAVPGGGSRRSPDVRRRDRRTALVAACAAVALVGASAPSAAVAPAAGAVPSGVGLTRVMGELDCPGSVLGEAAAVDLAGDCGREVEVASARTEWETLFAQPGGTMRLESSIAAVRTRVSGQWAPVDNSLVAVAGGFEVASPVVPMVFSDGGPGSPLVRMTRDGHELELDVPFELTVPVVSGAALTYPQVLPGVDLIVTVNQDATGFSQVLRVESAAAAGDSRLARLDFEVVVSDGLGLVEAGGGFLATDVGGRAVFSSPAPVMWDSSADRVQARGQAPAVERVAGRGVGERSVAPVEGDELAAVAVSVRGGLVTLAPDAGMLTDPETVWPVFIDPSVSGTRNEWTAVRDGFSPAYGFNTDQGTGKCDRARTTTCSKTFLSRLMYEFTGLGAVGALDPSQVLYAAFSAYGSHSYDCNPRPIQAFRVDGFSSATTWPGGPWTADRLQETLTVAHKPACGDDRWIEFDVTAAAQWVAAANASSVAIGLKAADESTMDGWKRYWYDAVLSVVYNRPPSTPSGLTVAPADSTVAGVTYTSTLTPTLGATLTDPDGGTVTARFVLLAHGVQIDTQDVSVPSGGVATWPVPAGRLVEGQQYSFTVAAADAYAWSEWSAEKVFVVQRLPDAPTGARTSSPDSECVTGPGRPVIGSATPVLRATLTDPDGGNLQGSFEIYDVATSALVWDPELTSGRASGSEHTVAVAVGVLSEGVAYQWRVGGVDPSGLAGPEVECEFVLDLGAPELSRVSHVLWGSHPSYTEDGTAGGVGQEGRFRFGEVFAADTFTRTVSSGFGSAEVGGGWQTTGSQANYSVTDGAGVILLPTPGSGPDVSLPSVVSSETDLTFALTIDKLTTGGGLDLSVGARRVAGVGEYRAKVRLRSDGTVTLGLARTAGSTQTVIVPVAVVSGLTYAAGDTLRMRVQATGTSPTTIRARVWNAANPEPSTWQAATTDSTPALQVPGNVGLNNFLSSSATNAPITLRLDDLLARVPGEAIDVAGYRYSFNNDGLASSVAADTNGGAQVTFAPTEPGPQVLYVQAVDAAGWTSPVRLYRFTAAFPGGG